MAQRIQIRRDTAANWTASNPILAPGEIGIVVDGSGIFQKQFKVGDGSTQWGSLELVDLTSLGGGTGGIANSYADIAALLADQGNQISGEIFEVTDASADFTVGNGAAWYRKKPSTLGALSDYVKISEAEAFDENNTYLKSLEYTLDSLYWEGSSGFDTYFFVLNPASIELAAYNGAFGYNWYLSADDVEAKIRSRHATAFRDETNTAYQNISIADPIGNNHATTKQWVEALFFGGGSPAVATVYADIAALLADQANQDEGVLYEVTDASTDSTVDSGRAIYKKLAATTGNIADYIKIFEQEALSENIEIQKSNLNVLMRRQLMLADSENALTMSAVDPTDTGVDYVIAGLSEQNRVLKLTLNTNVANLVFNSNYVPYVPYYLFVIQDNVGNRNVNGFADNSGVTTLVEIGSDNAVQTAANSVTKYMFMKDEDDVIYIQRLNPAQPAGGGGPAIDSIYADVATMLADQGNQTTDAIYEVTDASSDSTVGSGTAWYRKTSSSTSNISDYEKISEDEVFDENLSVTYNMFNTDVTARLLPRMSVLNATMTDPADTGNDQTINFSSYDYRVFRLSLETNIGIINPSNFQSYTPYYIEIKQDAIGGRTIGGFGAGAADVNSVVMIGSDNGIDTSPNAITVFRILEVDDGTGSYVLIERVSPTQQSDTRKISATQDLNTSQSLNFAAAKVIAVDAALTANREFTSFSNASASNNNVVIKIANPNGYAVTFNASLNVTELGSAPTSGEYTIFLYWLGGSNYLAIYPETPVFASQVDVDDSAFAGNLGTGDNTAQKVADKFDAFDFTQVNETYQYLLPDDAATVNIDLSLGTNVTLSLFNFTQNPVISISNPTIGESGIIAIKGHGNAPTFASNISAPIFGATTGSNVNIYKVITILEGGSYYHTFIEIASNVSLSEAAYAVEETIKVNFGNDLTTSPTANWNTAGSANADNANNTIANLIRFSDGASTAVSVTNDTVVGKANNGYDNGVTGGDDDGSVTKSFHTFSNATNWALKIFSGLDVDKYYQVKYLYSSSAAGTGDFKVTGLGGDIDTNLDVSMLNNSTYYVVKNVKPNSSGEIAVGFRDNGNLCAVILERSNKPDES